MKVVSNTCEKELGGTKPLNENCYNATLENFQSNLAIWLSSLRCQIAMKSKASNKYSINQWTNLWISVSDNWISKKTLVFSAPIQPNQNANLSWNFCELLIWLEMAVFLVQPVK